MAENDNNRRVAIACQGGGSHTAFTAGVLKKLFKEKGQAGHDYEVVGLSGTSGGSICALLAWYGLLMNDTNKAVELLDSFWRDNTANSPWDRFLNDWLLQTNRFFANIGGTPSVSPYFYPSQGQNLLKKMIEKHVDFGRLGELVQPSSPLLLVGAVNVLSGEFKAFKSHDFLDGDGRKVPNNSPGDGISVEAILASAAIPVLFRAVDIGKDVYWDGLFSQNPPVRELPDTKPTEIWVIQVDPQTHDSEPKRMSNILDRRNELAGNLSLNQEIYFIEKINEWVRHGRLSGTKHEVIEVKWIRMLHDLDAESKLNRSPSFIQGLMNYGEQQAEEFLRGEFAEVGGRTG
jgi:NTE family protein